MSNLRKKFFTRANVLHSHGIKYVAYIKFQQAAINLCKQRVLPRIEFFKIPRKICALRPSFRLHSDQFAKCSVHRALDYFNHGVPRIAGLLRRTVANTVTA